LQKKMKHKLFFWIIPTYHLPKAKIIKHKCVIPFQPYNILAKGGSAFVNFHGQQQV
jgi:hypothetical protein